jgi:hypothetical protein
MRRLLAIAIVLPAAMFAAAMAAEVQAVRISVPGEGVLRISAAELSTMGLPSDNLFVYTGGRGMDYVRTADGIDIYCAPFRSVYDARRSILVSRTALPYPGTSKPLTPSSAGAGSSFLSKGTAKKLLPGPDWYTETSHVEEDQYYLSGLTKAVPGEDHWFYSTILTPGKSLTLNVPARGPLAAGDASLTVALRGCSDAAGVRPDHCIEVKLNGQRLGEMLWNGYTRLEQAFTVPAGLAGEGNNVLSLTSQPLPGVVYDFVMADWVKLTYPRRLAADGDRLAARFDLPANTRLVAGGFSGPDIIGLDVTDPASPSWLKLTIAQEGATWSAEWVAAYAGPRHYVLAGPTGRLAGTPVRSSTDPLEAWRTGGHINIVVSHADHLSAANRLAELHGGSAARVRVYDAEDVYDAFSCGQRLPEAIRALARHHQPQYLCLVGDTSADMAGRLKAPASGLLPSFLVQGDHFEEASDNLFGCIGNNDEYPDIAVGRLPARTLAEANVMVDKIAARMACEWSDYGGVQSALVVGDNDQAIFLQGAAEMADLFSWGATERIMFSDYASAAAIRAAIVAGWPRNPRYFAYYGHAASTYLGKSKVLRDADVANLKAAELPAGIMLCCLAGCFNLTAGTDSLAEKMLKTPDRGVSALIAPSGMSAPEGQLILGRELAKLIQNEPGIPMGRALMLAKSRMPTAHADVLRSFNLLGDPAMR